MQTLTEEKRVIIPFDVRHMPSFVQMDCNLTEGSILVSKNFCFVHSNSVGRSIQWKAIKYLSKIYHERNIDFNLYKLLNEDVIGFEANNYCRVAYKDREKAKSISLRSDQSFWQDTFMYHMKNTVGMYWLCLQ